MTVSEKLRLVQGLHSHAEMFGFNWNDDSDWTWHDVACKIADEIDAENAKLRKLVADMWRFTGTACKKYPRLFDPAAQGGQMVQLNMLDSFEQRMRELGIEVNG